MTAANMEILYTHVDRNPKSTLVGFIVNRSFSHAVSIGYEKEELIGTGYLGLVKGLTTFDENKGGLVSHLSACIKHEIIDFIRKNYNHPIVNLEFGEREPAKIVSEETGSLIDSSKIQKGLKVLSKKEKEYIHRSFYLGESDRQLMTSLNIGRKTTMIKFKKNIFKKLKLRLKPMWDKYNRDI